jgi:periplasmic protein TonB
VQYVYNPKPKYPNLSRRHTEEGTVTVHVLVGVDGKPQQIKLARSSGFERLDQAALNGIKGWLFSPPKVHGVIQAVWVEIPMPFNLQTTE